MDACFFVRAGLVGAVASILFGPGDNVLVGYPVCVRGPLGFCAECLRIILRVASLFTQTRFLVCPGSFAALR